MIHRLDPIRCYHSRPEWIWEQWQWRATPHSPKLQYYWSLTIKWFSVIDRTLFGWGLTPLQKCTWCILEPQPTGLLQRSKVFQKKKCSGYESDGEALILEILGGGIDFHDHYSHVHSDLQWWYLLGALDVHEQLSNYKKANVGLIKAFAMDPCTAYKHFTTWTLIATKTVDVFFMTLKKLAVLFGGLPERTFAYMFVTGLPARVKQLLRASTSIEATLIKQLLEHARAIIRDEAELGKPVLMPIQTALSSHTNPLRLDPQARMNCFHFGQFGHITKVCTDKRCGYVRCFQCGLKLSGKRARGQDVSAALLPGQGATNHPSTHWPNALLSTSGFRQLLHHSEHKAVLHLEQEER